MPHAPATTFDGTGPAVTWRAPASAATPVEVILTLHVIEQCATGQTASQHDISVTTSAAHRRFMR